MSAKASEELSASLSSLKVSTTMAAKAPASKKKSAPVADSWDDGEDDSSTETEDNGDGGHTRNSSTNPVAPPPTPASPISNLSFAPSSESFSSYYGSPQQGGRTSDTDRGPPSERPDKTTSAASRMIAAGLGMRAPRRTEEERAYDKAMREKQAKLKDDKKKEETEKEKARAAIWDD